MYEMNCGSCGNVMRTSFVRYGAVATCSKCGVRFPVNSQTTRRVAAVSADADLLPGPAGAGPAVSATGGAVGAGTSAQAKGNVGGNSIISPGVSSGDSQSSAAAERAPSRPVRRPAQPPRVGQGPVQPTTAAPELELAKVVQDERRAYPRYASRGRRVQKLLLLGVIFMGVLGLVVIGALISQSQRPFGGEYNASLPGGHEFPSLDPALPLVTVYPVERPVWELSAEPLPELANPARVRFENQRFFRASTGQVMLQGTVELDSFEIYEGCVLHLRLISREGHVFAKTRVLLMALNGQKPRQISIDVPPELSQRMELVEYNAEATLAVSPGTAFEQIVYVATPWQKEHTALQITAYNPLSRPISRAIFVITAYNSTEQPEAQWTATWSQPVDAKQRIEFAVLLPVAKDSVVRWDITGAGIAATEEQP